MTVSYKLNVITILGIYPKELKTDNHPETCTQIFIGVLVVITQAGKQPSCPSAGEWINKLWYTQTTEKYSALKRKELSKP